MEKNCKFPVFSRCLLSPFSNTHFQPFPFPIPGISDIFRSSYAVGFLSFLTRLEFLLEKSIHGTHYKFIKTQILNNEGQMYFKTTNDIKCKAFHSSYRLLLIKRLSWLMTELISIQSAVGTMATVMKCRFSFNKAFLYLLAQLLNYSLTPLQFGTFIHIKLLQRAQLFNTGQPFQIAAPAQVNTLKVP